MSRMRGGGGGGGGGVDPSNLHLKKELTQIRKAARVLRDPGTTSSWRSPVSTARSTVANVVCSSTTNRYYHHFRNNNSNGNRIGGGAKNNSNERGKQVFLYNWRSQKSESEKSVATAKSDDKRLRHKPRGEAAAVDVANDGDNDEYSSMPEERVDDTLSDARNDGGGGDSKSDTCISDRYTSMIFKCNDTKITSPTIRRVILKKKSKKIAHSAAGLRHHHHQLPQQIVMSKSSNRALDDLVSLLDQSDDTGEYLNSEDLRRVSVASPLLSMLKSSKLLRSSRKGDSSYSCSTPALSTNSFNRFFVRNPSPVGSWDATTESFNNGSDEVDDPLDLAGSQGCGIPCNWSRRITPKHRGVRGSCYSPSLSDTLRRKGSSILCGSRSMYHRRRRGSSLSSNKRRLVSRTARGLVPLLSSSSDRGVGSSTGTRHSNDELSTNYGELDLEALNRLDGRRWSSSCRSQEGLELVALNGEEEEKSMMENIRSLSQKYRPMFFEELIGQNIVVQSLMNTIQRRRIAPIYLFLGPRGTGKTSTARIFAAALNCLARDETKPCGVCKECVDFISGKTRDLREVDGSNKKGIDIVRNLLKNLSVAPPSALLRYKVFVIDRCHLLPSKMWLSFLKFLEEPPPHVVFAFITTDLDNVPCAVLSRCQKYLFNKIKDGDIVTRLRKIATNENLDVESAGLDLIALNADGSLRDAENMLDQLSLLGKRITTSLVNELVGVVSDEKLLELLELAMSSDTAETVKRARELMDSGVDPMALMSQLATLIVDVISGTFHISDSRYNDSFFCGRSLTDAELEKLKHALKLLSEAEKQLRVSSERSTWFTATLLQLGSAPSPDPTQSGSRRRQSSKTTEEDPSSTFRESIAQKQRRDANYAPRKSTSPTPLPKATHRNATSQDDHGVSSNSKPTYSKFINGDSLAVSHDDSTAGNTKSRCINSSTLDDIWVRCIEGCHSKTLRQLLHTYGKLVTISEVEGALVAYIVFVDREIKIRAGRFLSSITNSFEIVLRRNIEVRIMLLPDDETFINSAYPVVTPESLVQKQMDPNEVINKEKQAFCSNAIDGYSDLGSHQEPIKVSKGSFNDSKDKMDGKSTAGSPVPLLEGNAIMTGTKESKPKIPVQRIESIIHEQRLETDEQRLETAWLQATEKGTPGSMSCLKPERNQILPQDGVYHHNQMKLINSMNVTSHDWEDGLNHEINTLKINDGKALQKDQTGKMDDHYLISPSLLHDNSLVGNLSKESMGYDSGSGAGGCSGLFCWNNTKHHKKGEAKQGNPMRSHKGGRFLWLGECAKSRRSENRFRR